MLAPGQRQQDLLDRLRAAIDEIERARRPMDRRRHQLGAEYHALWQEARALVVARDDAGARRILEQRAAIGPQLRSFETQVAGLADGESRLRLAEHRLIGRMEEFRMRREVISAQEAAAEAQAHISEALAGLSTDLGATGRELDRAERRTEQFRARSAAIESLLELGALESYGWSSRTDPAGEAGAQDPPTIDEELAALRVEVAHERP
jgi:phage shock protein A